jgi:50S ribosomal protein L16 3-hydroxylase
MSHSDFQSILADPSLSKQLFYKDKITVHGSMMLAGQVPNLLTLANSRRPPGGLSALFAPMLRKQFLATNWPDKLTVVPDSPARLSELTDIPAFRSISTFFDAWPGLARVPDETLQPADVARRYFEAGASISFDMADKVLPELRPWLSKLQLDLCLPANVMGRCIVYASAKGTGARMHFDQNANFVVHLHGEKIWRVAPNRHVTNPTEQYIVGMAGLPRELQLYCRSDMPQTMPADYEEIPMRRGSVMFLPRGYWHATEASEDSLQLNFTFSQPSWADALLPALQRRLLRHEHWRALAYGAGAGDPIRQRAAEDHFQKLLEHLLEDLAPLNAGEIISEIRPVEAATDVDLGKS